MAYGTDLPTLPDEHLLSRRPWYIVGIGLLLLSVPLRMPLLIVAGLLVIVLGAVPEIWYRFCLAGVSVRRSFSTRRAEIGDEVILTLTIDNRKLLPLPRLEVEDEVPEEGVSIRGARLETSVKPLRLLQINVLSLWAFQRVTRRYRMRCLARGIYTFGPMTLRSGDPFGLLTRERSETAVERVLIYPLVVPLERFGLPARAPFGERPAPRRLLEDPLRIGGVRPYEPGDEPRRIHWKATARTGELQSKVFEPSAHHTLAIFADQRTYDNPVLGYDPALVELAISVAASVATWGLEQGYAVGLYANGILAEAEAVAPTMRGPNDAPLDEAAIQRAIASAKLRIRIPPSTSRDHIVRIQESLARVIPYFATPITEILAAEESRLPYGSTVVYIGTPSGLGGEGIEQLRRLRARGAAVALLLVGDESLEAGDLPLTRVGNAATWDRLLNETLALRGTNRWGQQQPRESVPPGTEATPRQPRLEMEVGA
ncbi:MAG: DUF58 domain-containing protein [Ktedonobacterales bacterium]|nr:DUF58 domain-containing protein [Ktedonobacterales bacterium]